MSRTYRNERIKARTHDRGECPLCQENLHHKHKRYEDEDEEIVLEKEDDNELARQS